VLGKGEGGAVGADMVEDCGFSRVVPDATTMSSLAVCWIRFGMCAGSFSRSASIVIVVGYFARRIP
jgi:hypothetical protein